MRRGFLWLTGLIPVIVAAGCTAGGSISLTATDQGHTYRDAAGWAIEVPPGWHAVRFSDSAGGIISAGVQLSNVQLPAPQLRPGYPIQVNGRLLPARGVGLIIATDTDPKLSRPAVAVPPLPAPGAPKAWRYWGGGSASAGSPYIETLWFRANRTTFIASAKIGPKATTSDLTAVDTIITSLH